jgi:hypothetical protein
MPPNDPFKLDYRDGAKDLMPARAAAGAFVGGVVCGVIGTAMIGFGVAASVLGGRGAPCWPAVIGFGFGALGGLIGAVYFLGRGRRRMFLAGLLLGIMLVSMIESACFYQG